MNTKCFECGQIAHHRHHVVPKVLGGNRTVCLCHRCHSKVHDCKLISCAALSKLGIRRKARALGISVAEYRKSFINSIGAKRNASYSGMTIGEYMKAIHEKAAKKLGISIKVYHRRRNEVRRKTMERKAKQQGITLAEYQSRKTKLGMNRKAKALGITKTQYNQQVQAKNAKLNKNPGRRKLLRKGA